MVLLVAVCYSNYMKCANFPKASKEIKFGIAIMIYILIDS